jgi:hypothetical protein
MAASYPASVKSFSTKTTGQTIAASHVNDLQDEVTAIETALLTGPLTANGFVPSVTATYDLGSSSLKYRDGYFSRNVLIGGTLGVTGATSLSSTANVVGDFSVNTNKFNVTASNGNTSVAGIFTATQSSGSLVRHQFFNTNAGSIQTDLQIGRGDATHDLFVGVNFSGSANAYLDNRSGGSLLFKVNGTDMLSMDSAGALTAQRSIVLSHATNPFIRMTKTSGGTVSWDFQNNGGDANITDGTHAITLQQSSGDFLYTGAMRERNRSFAMGATQAVSYNGGNFTASGGATWTVESGDQTTFNYSLVGDTMTVRARLTTTSITVATPLTLLIAIPNSMTAQETFSILCSLLDNGTTRTGFVQVTSGNTTIAISRQDGGNFALSTNLTWVEFEIAFKVS